MNYSIFIVVLLVCIGVHVGHARFHMMTHRHYVIHRHRGSSYQRQQRDDNLVLACEQHIVRKFNTFRMSESERNFFLEHHFVDFDHDVGLQYLMFITKSTYNSFSPECGIKIARSTPHTCTIDDKVIEESYWPGFFVVVGFVVCVFWSLGV